MYSADLFPKILYIIPFHFRKIVLLYKYKDETERSNPMAKKFGKFLLFTATVGAAAAAAAYYLQKKKLFPMAEHDGDDDYDDFSEDSDTENDSSRTYVQLNPGNKPEAEGAAAETKDSSVKAAADSSAKDSFTPLAENAPRTTAKKSEETVEEFFDEEDAAEEDSLLKDTN